MTDYPNNISAKLEIIKASEITPKEVRYLLPRFNSAGGGGDRLIFIKEDEKSLTFGDDRIREAVEKYHAKLLILDPMSSYIGDTCSMNNANETRAEFNHLIAGATILMSWSLM